MRTQSLDMRFIIEITIAAVFSVMIGITFQPTAEGDFEVVRTVVTIISVLAGFLIASMVIVAKPAITYAKDGRELQLMKDSVYRMLLRFKLIFLLFIATLCLALAIRLSSDHYKWVLEMVFLSLSVFDLLISLKIPGILISMHMDIYDLEIEKHQPKIVHKAKDELRLV